MAPPGGSPCRGTQPSRAERVDARRSGHPSRDPGGPTRRVIDLTPAQAAVIRELACDGATNAEIADRLGVTRWTVKTHVRAVMTRADIHDRAALAVAVLRRRVCIRIADHRDQLK